MKIILLSITLNLPTHTAFTAVFIGAGERDKALEKLPVAVEIRHPIFGVFLFQSFFSRA